MDIDIKKYNKKIRLNLFLKFIETKYCLFKLTDHVLPMSLIDLVLDLSGPHLMKGAVYLIRDTGQKIKKSVFVGYLTDNIYLFHETGKGLTHVLQHNIIQVW